MQHTQTHRKSTPGISHQQHKEKKRKRRDELDDIDHADQVCGSDMCDEKKDEGGDHEVEESAGVGVNIEVQEEEKQPAHLTTYTMIATHTSTSLLHNNWAACLPTILSFLQWKEIMLCRSVSRDMQSASYTLQAWKYVYLRYGELAHLCAADLRSLAPLQSVHLVGCRETYPSPDLLFAHLQHLPALRTLMLTQSTKELWLPDMIKDGDEDIQPADIQAYLQLIEGILRCSQLESFDGFQTYRACPSLVRPRTWMDYLIKYQPHNLRRLRLKLHGMPLHHLHLHLFINLTHVSLSFNSPPDAPDSCPYTLTQIGSLRSCHADMSIVWQIDEYDMPFSMVQLASVLIDIPQLTSLSVYSWRRSPTGGSTSVDDGRQMLSHIGKIKSLQQLTITSKFNMTVEAVQELSHLPLRCLEPPADDLIPVGMGGVLSSMPSLTDLSLDYRHCSPHLLRTWCQALVEYLTSNTTKLSILLSCWKHQEESAAVMRSLSDAHEYDGLPADFPTHPHLIVCWIRGCLINYTTP